MQIHEELARKDAELEQIKGQHQRLVAENNSLKLEVEKLATEAEDLSRTSMCSYCYIVSIAIALVFRVIFCFHNFIFMTVVIRQCARLYG